MSRVIRLRPDTFKRLLALASALGVSVQTVIERLLDWHDGKGPAL